MAHRTKLVSPRAKKLSRELAYVLGVHYGDKVRKKSNDLNCTDLDFINEYKKNIEKWSGFKCTKIKLLPKQNEKWKQMYSIRLYSTDVNEFLENFNIKLLSNSNIKIKSAFLRGFFDSEGTATITKIFTKLGRPNGYNHKIACVNTNFRIIELCQKLLGDLAMPTIINKYQPKRPNEKLVYQLVLRRSKNNYIKFANLVGFSIVRKQGKLLQIINNYSFTASNEILGPYSYAMSLRAKFGYGEKKILRILKARYSNLPITRGAIRGWIIKGSKPRVLAYAVEP